MLLLLTYGSRQKHYFLLSYVLAEGFGDRRLVENPISLLRYIEIQSVSRE